MTRHRSTLVSPSDTPYYHCIGRCVRRAFLCDEDPVTGKSFDHRKGLILERLTPQRAALPVARLAQCRYYMCGNPRNT